MPFRKLALTFLIFSAPVSYTNPLEDPQTPLTPLTKRQEQAADLAPQNLEQKKLTEEDNENALYGIFLFLVGLYWTY